MNGKMIGSLFAVFIIVSVAAFVVVDSSDTDAASGSASDPVHELTGFSSSIDGSYIAVGGTVNFIGSAAHPFLLGFYSVSSGFGLTISQTSAFDSFASSDSRWGDCGKSLSGTVSKTGDIEIQYLFTNSDPSSPSLETVVIHVVESNPEADIDFTSPSAVSGVSGGSISYTAKTNIGATFSESGGTGASWLSVNSSSGRVSGTFPSVSSITSYTYIIKATSETNSSNTATQTITITVYPVAKITASDTSVTGTENETISSVSLSGNLGMSFSRYSGSFPDGITLSGSRISGTPTESGSFSVVIRGTTNEGPTQLPTVTISFTIDPAESDLVFSISDPAASYKVGESISLDLSSNVTGTTFSVSGTASSFMSVSGSKVVGSVPSSFADVTDLTLTVRATTPNGQAASDTVSFSVEPVIEFTSVPTADCIINPVYTYDGNGNPVLSSGFSLLTDVYADGGEVDFTFSDTLTICGTFIGQNAQTVTWDWGDGTTDTGNKVEHTYETPGTYTITLTATNDIGSDVLTLTVTVGESAYSLLYYASMAVLLVIIIVLAYYVLVGRDGRRGR